MKKLVCLLLVLALSISLCACGARQKSDLELAQEQYKSDLEALEAANKNLKKAQENLDYVNSLLGALGID